jgi:hypothetical protein
MGLAASQARYLSLSARKTNVEYEGQQINQQRLTLSNQSADLFNQMLTMSVPVCPDSSSYTKLQYSWSDGVNTSVLEDYYRMSEPNSDFNYVVTSYHYEQVYTGQRKNLKDPQVQAKKTNHFTTKDVTSTLVSKSYDSNKDIFTLELEKNGQTLAYTYKSSDQNSNSDVTEQIDAMYNRTTSTSSAAFTYDDTNDTWTDTAGGGTVYSLVDKEDATTLKQLKDSYGALYDNTKTYYATGTGAATKYICAEDIPVAQEAGADITVRNLDQTKYYTDGTNYLSTTEIAALTIGNDVTAHTATNDPTFSNYSAVGNCELTEISQDDYNESSTIPIEVKQILSDMKADSANTAYYEHLAACFDDNGTYKGGIYQFTMSGVTYYTTASDLDSSLASAYKKNATANNGIDNQSDKLAYYNASYIDTKVTEVKQALLETDGTGRFSSVKFEDDSVVYDLSVETITDETAYNDAMNKYYYQQEQYDKQVSDINAKTEILQQQDRKLELQLEQLNTEQSALQTEMEACQKVVSKNIDNSFKTFNS